MGMCGWCSSGQLHMNHFIIKEDALPIHVTRTPWMISVQIDQAFFKKKFLQGAGCRQTCRLRIALWLIGEMINKHL